MSATAMEKPSAYEKLGLREKIGYGMGDAGSGMIWSVLALYLTWFYTDVYGLNAGVVGTLFLVIRIFDAFSDPLMGAICDRTVSRWGKFRPWLLWMAFPFGLGAVLMFTTPELSMNGKIIYAWVTYLVMSLIYTAINIPYCSVGGVITLNQKERMGCLSWRFFLNGLATLIISSSILPLTDWLGNGDRASGFQLTMIIMGGAATLMFLFCFSSIKERVVSVKQNESLKKDLRDIIKNDQWLLMITITFLNVFPAFIRGGVTIYYATYVMKESVGFITFFMALGVACNMLGWILAFTGYVANEPQQNSQTIQGIIMMFSLLPMVSYFISAYLVRYFKLNNAFLEKIKTDLAKRELEKGRGQPQEVQDVPVI